MIFRKIVKKIVRIVKDWRDPSKCDCGGDLPFFPTYIDDRNIGIYVCKKCKKEWCFF